MTATFHTGAAFFGISDITYFEGSIGLAVTPLPDNPWVSSLTIRPKCVWIRPIIPTWKALHAAHRRGGCVLEILIRLAELSFAALHGQRATPGFILSPRG